MSDELEQLAATEAARVKSRDRKVRGPKVVVDNAGLRKATMALAERLRRKTADPDGKPAG